MSWTPRMFSGTKSAEGDGELHTIRFSFDKPRELDDLFDEHKAGIAELKEILAGELSKPENKIYDDDVWILRFFLNPKYDTKKNAERYLKMIKLREQEGVNQIREKLLEMQKENQDDIENLPKKFDKYEDVNRAFPESLWHTNDIYDQPVAVQLFGKADLKYLTGNMDKEEFYQYALWKAEYIRLNLDRVARDTGTLVQWVQVIDLTGLGMKHMNTSAVDIVKSASTRVDQMYKECFGKILVCNAPRVFHMLWAMMKVWLNERTKQKVTLLGTSFKEDIAQCIPKSQMPAFLGGDVQSGHIAFQDF